MAGPARPGRSDARESWPERIDPRLAALLVDSRWIAYLDRQPYDQVQAWQRRRVGRLITHAASGSPWWRERLLPLSAKSVALNDLPLMSREEYRASIETIGGPLALPTEHG